MSFPKFEWSVFAKISGLILLQIFLIVSVGAQSGTTSISGVVTDANGAAVPGAAVTITNPETGFTRNTTTSEDGKFGFPGIQPATYRVEVSASNFKKTVNNSAQALVEKPLELNVALETGDVSAIVDVSSNTIESIVNTQDASLGNNFVPKQITQLPTDLRRVADLMTLQPGVTRDGYVAGGRADQANVLLDGVDINDQQNGGRPLLNDGTFLASQDTVLRATAESVEEFRITTTNGNANQGRSSGAQISLVTKSGTNDFHGSLFYFYRPTAFSANSFFNNAAGRYTADDFLVQNGTVKAGQERAARPSLARDVFGGSLGGPIIKDKLFFFYTYEGQRQKQGVPVVRIVPLAHLGLGQIKFSGTLPGEVSCETDPGDPGCIAPHPITVNLSDLNSIYSQAGINPLSMSILADAARRYPANDNSVGDGVNTGGFRFNAPTHTSENTHIARFDYRLTGSQSLFFRANYQWDNATGASWLPDTPSTALWDHPLGFVIGHDWSIGSNRVNNFRYGFTRQAFTTSGDSNSPGITFRFVFQPVEYTRTLSRVTPTQNFTDDFTWIKGNHTFQFGGNVRIIRNKRSDLSASFDSAVTNPSFYDQSGAVLDAAFSDAGYSIGEADVNTVQAAATALIGRYSQYSGNFIYDIQGNPLQQGTIVNRDFATEEYDAYAQDIWKPLRNLTLTLGLRYGVSRPVYEQNGFQVVPTEPLGHFFDRRVFASENGVALNDLISFERGGPANNGPGFYKTDWNNWQPRVAAAWSPNFKSGWLKTIFGGNNESVFRGGFAITNDHFGGQLAVSFDNLSTIGFTEAITVAANTYNVTDRLAPRFTGFDQSIRGLPGVPVSPAQRFNTEVDPSCLAGIVQCPQRIEESLDGTITTPTHYTWNLSYGRELPKGIYFEASYIGRKARHLLVTRDIMALNDLTDRQSGMDWYTAAGMLHDMRAADVPFNSPSVNVPYFNNIFGANMPARLQSIIERDFGFHDDQFDTLNPTQAVLYLVSRQGYDILDWTFVQSLLDDAGPTPNLFFHPQYAAFSAFSTIGKSDYNGATFTLRQRLGQVLSYDINYTFAKSMDNASGLESGATGTSGGYGTNFILNPLRPQDNRAVSDFDIRHNFNANFIFELPIGKGRHFYNGANSLTDALIGGWQLAGIFRWNTGPPLSVPVDAAQWATNWNAQSAGTRISPLQIQIDRNAQNAFADPQQAFNSFRNARPGETGERNALRISGFSTLDLGLGKSFNMPWYEGHQLQFRWEVFNVLNYQYFNVTGNDLTRSSWGLPQDPEGRNASGDFGRIFSTIQGIPRRMQFGLRYSF